MLKVFCTFQALYSFVDTFLPFFIAAQGAELAECSDRIGNCESQKHRCGQKDEGIFSRVECKKTCGFCVFLPPIL